MSCMICFIIINEEKWKDVILFYFIILIIIMYILNIICIYCIYGILINVYIDIYNLIEFIVIIIDD